MGSCLLFRSEIIFCNCNRNMTLPPCSEENEVYLKRFSCCPWRHRLTWIKIIITFPQRLNWTNSTQCVGEKSRLLELFELERDIVILLFFLLYQFHFIFGIFVVGTRHLFFNPYFTHMEIWLGHGDGLLRSPRLSVVETILYKLSLKHSDLPSHISDFG